MMFPPLKELPKVSQVVMPVALKILQEMAGTVTIVDDALKAADQFLEITRSTQAQRKLDILKGIWMSYVNLRSKTHRIELTRFGNYFDIVSRALGVPESTQQTAFLRALEQERPSRGPRAPSTHTNGQQGAYVCRDQS